VFQRAPIFTLSLKCLFVCFMEYDFELNVLKLVFEWRSIATVVEASDDKSWKREKWPPNVMWKWWSVMIEKKKVNEALRERYSMDQLENDGPKSKRMVMVSCKMSIVNYKMVKQLERFEDHEKPFLQFFKLFFILLFIYFFNF